MKEKDERKDEPSAPAAHEAGFLSSSMVLCPRSSSRFTVAILSAFSLC